MSILDDNIIDRVHNNVTMEAKRELMIWSYQKHRWTVDGSGDDRCLYERDFYTGIYKMKHNKYKTALVPAYREDSTATRHTITIRTSRLKLNDDLSISVLDPKYPVVILDNKGEKFPEFLTFKAGKGKDIHFICFDIGLSWDYLQSKCPTNPIYVERVVKYEHPR